MTETTTTQTRRTSTGSRKSCRVTKSPEDRAAEVEALAAPLNEAGAELTTSEAWLGMLRVAALFTRYSSSNVLLLLWMQAEQRWLSRSRVAE